MSGFTAVDLSRMPAPVVVQAPDFEVILQERKDKLAELWPPIAEYLNLEAEPAVKIQETGAYRELMHYARVNSAARAVMLAFAQSSDLDQLAALFGVTRMSGETDARFRARVNIAPDAYPGAGPAAGIIYHAMSADIRVKDVGLARIQYRGDITVSILSTEGDGSPSPEVLTAVRQRLLRDDIRLMTDTISVMAATLTPYSISVKLRIPRGPDPAIVRGAAETALAAYSSARHRVGGKIYLSALQAEAYTANVEQVIVLSPGADILTEIPHAPRATSITVTTEVIGE